MEILLYISATISAILSIFSVYFFILALFALKRFKKPPKAAPKNKFAIIIAARNEAKVINELIDSLNAQTYPGDLFDIFVFPNNCTDNTAEVAAKKATVISCDHLSIKCKGDALTFAFDTLMNEPYHYDAFCVFDADNVVDRNFLSEMNDSLCNGANIIKGRGEVKNPYDTWVSGCYALYFSMCNIFVARSRANIGLSAKLIGTGFCVSRQLMEKLGGWHTKTITEDVEFSTICALSGDKVHWAPDALYYDEAPNSFSVSMTQRTRWISGIMQVAQIYLPSIFKTIKKGSFRLLLDYILYLSFPFSRAFSVVPTIITIIAYAIFAGGSLLNYLIISLGSLALSYIGLCIGSLILTLLTGLSVKKAYKGIFTYYLFTLTWLPIYIYSLFVKTTSWKEIRHDRNIKAEDVVEIKSLK